MQSILFKYKVLIAVISQLALGFFLHLAWPLITNAIFGWADDRIAERFGMTSPTIQTVIDFSIKWGVPFGMSAAIIYGVWTLARKTNAPPPANMTIGDFIQVVAKAHVAKQAEKPVVPYQPSEQETPIDLSVLYATDEEKKLIWLRFDPDTKDRSDDLLLILYGYKMINRLDEVPVSQINTSLKLMGAKTSDNFSFSNVFFISHCDELAKKYIHSRISEKIRLSQGGAYKLLDRGEAYASALARDIIRRA